MEIYNRIINNKPFCFIRINDGEAKAIMSDVAFASRGDEQSSKELSLKLKNIVSDTWYSKDLFIGVPCISCYKDQYDYVQGELVKSKPYEFIISNTMDANILINNNYDKTLSILMDNLPNRNVIIISNETIISNIDKLESCLGIRVEQAYVVSAKMAFRNDYHKLKDLIFQNGSFIITLCGPLGRVLAYEWFKRNITLSCLDLGSFFDPLLRNKAYLYHTNNHRYCFNCYPTANSRFTKIFNYCVDFVDKECYYLNTFDDHVNLYNHDYNRIVLNTLIRLEKEPNNPEIHKILACAKVQLFNQATGYNFGSITSNFKTLIEICKYRNPLKALEIGFGASTIILLEYTNAYITCVDICEFNTEYLSSVYKNRLTFINGNSADVIPSLTELYCLIHIDGSKEYSVAFMDLINCYYKSCSDTLLLINGVIKNPKLQDNLGIIKAYNKCISEGLLKVVREDDFEYGQGMAIARYICNDKFIRCNLLLKSMSKYDYIISLIDTIEDENEFKKIMTYIEETKLLKLKKDSQEGYAFQVPEQFSDLINFCHSKPFNNILEIGFLHGSSALMFLLNTDAKVTSIDLETNEKSETYLLNKFPDRFKIIHGNSKDILPELMEEYDLIYIDGGHEYKTVKDDILACQYLMTDDCYIIMNDVVTDPNFCMFWNDGPTRVFKEMTEIDIEMEMNEDSIEMEIETELKTEGETEISDIIGDIMDDGVEMKVRVTTGVYLEKTYNKGRGLAIFQFKKKDYIYDKSLNKSDICKEINTIVKCINRRHSKQSDKQSSIMTYLLQKLNVLVNAYLKYFSMILENNEYYTMKYYYAMSCTDLTNMEDLISDRSLPEDIKNEASIHLENKYTNAQVSIQVSIPKIVHLVYINQRPLKSFNYKCIYSILKHMPDYKIWIHNDIEPESEEWKLLTQNDNIVVKKITRINEFDNMPITCVQYESDIIRMNLLYEHGGIYFDTDIYLVKNVDGLLDGHSLYIARETEDNIINCTIISEPNNEFIKIWLQNFATGFRMGNWGWHIRDLPKILLDQHPYYISKYNIKVLNYENFCPIHWTQPHLLNDPNFEITEKMYGIHLFETILGNSLDNSVIVK